MKVMRVILTIQEVLAQEMLSFLLYQENTLIIITSHIHTSNLSFSPQRNCVWSRCHGRVHLCVSVVQEGVSLSHYQTALPHPPSGCVNLELWIIQGNWPWFTHIHTHPQDIHIARCCRLAYGTWGPLLNLCVSITHLIYQCSAVLQTVRDGRVLLSPAMCVIHQTRL